MKKTPGSALLAVSLSIASLLVACSDGGGGGTGGGGAGGGGTSPRPIVESFQIDPGQAQDLMAATGVGVAFAAGSLETASGGSPAPSATVELASYLGDSEVVPTDMPGTFEGHALSGASVALASYGVLGITITDSSGATLNLKTGASATLTIPSINGSSGPATAPLWYMPESGGAWTEESAAELVGGVYKGSVPHFSLWNVDIACNHACIRGVVTDGDKKPLGGVEVFARASSSACQWYTEGALAGGSTITFADGSYQIDWLPADSTIEVWAVHVDRKVARTVVIPATGEDCVDVAPLVFGDSLGDCGTFSVLDEGDSNIPGSGLVQDLTTGLVWTRFMYDPEWDGVEPTNHENAVKFCADKGMRLPTKEEALEISGYTGDQACGWGYKGWVTWTSTPAGSGLAWIVYASGELDTGVVNHSFHPVMCVK